MALSNVLSLNSQIKLKNIDRKKQIVDMVFKNDKSVCNGKMDKSAGNGNMDEYVKTNMECDVKIYSEICIYKNVKVKRYDIFAAINSGRINSFRVKHCGDDSIYYCGKYKFAASEIPTVDCEFLDEIKAKDNVIDFGMDRYFKYVSSDNVSHCLYSRIDSSIAGLITDNFRGEPYDKTLWDYAKFWNILSSDNPYGGDFSREKVQEYLEEAGIKHGFFSVKVGNRVATHYYTASKTNGMVESKDRYDQYYKAMTEGTLFTDHDVGETFIIGGKQYVLNDKHGIDIEYGEDIYDIQYKRHCDENEG